MNGDVAILITVAVGFAALVGGAVWLGRTAHQRTRENLRALADRLGLTFAPGKGWFGHPRADGRRRGKPLELFNYTTGSGKSRQVWSAIRARPAAAGDLTFTIRPQGFGTKVLGFFGAKEIAVGDRAFDDAWFVRTNQPDFFRAALIPEIRDKFAAARQAGAKGHFALEKGVVVYAEAGTFYDRGRCARFETLAEVVCDLADIAEVSIR
ncbi:MAG TPA: hypothetical protein VGD81_14575 [Opitutaceae bacterium]